MNPLAGRPKAVDAEQQAPPSVVAVSARVPISGGGRARRRPLSATTGAGRQYALRQRVKGPLIRCQEFIERAAAAAEGTDEFDAATLRTMLLDAGDAIADSFEPASLSAASADHSAVLFDLSATADPGAFSPPRLSAPRTAHRSHRLGTTTLLHVAVRHGCVRPDLVEELVSLGAATSCAWLCDGLDGATPLQLSLKLAPHLTVMLLRAAPAPCIAAARAFLHDVLRMTPLGSGGDETFSPRLDTLSVPEELFAASRAVIVRALLAQYGAALLEADGAGETALGVLSANARIAYSRSEAHEMFLLLNSDAVVSGDGTQTQQRQHRHSSFLFHPLLRVLAVLLLIATHITTFAIDTYLRGDSGAAAGNATAIGPRSAESVAFVVRVVNLFASPFLDASTHPGLFAARVLCAVVGAAVGALSFAFAVQPLLLRGVLRLRMFGAEAVAPPSLLDDDRECSEQPHQQRPPLSPEARLQAALGRSRGGAAQSSAVPQELDTEMHSDDADDADWDVDGGVFASGSDVPFADLCDAPPSQHAAATRRSLTDCVRDSTRALRAQFDARLEDAAAAAVAAADSEADAEKRVQAAADELSGETQLRDFIGARGRVALVPLGVWVGLFCGALAYEAIENAAGVDIEDAAAYARRFNATRTDITFATLAPQLFHVNLYLLAALLLVVPDAALQCLGPTAQRIAAFGAAPAAISPRLHRLARWWRGATTGRFVLSLSLHVLLLGLLAAYHYASSGGGSFEIPLLFQPADDSAAAEMLATLACLDAVSILLVVTLLLQEQSLPNAQALEIVVPAASTDDGNNSNDDGVGVPLTNVRHALFLPALPWRGNPTAWALALAILELAVDVIRTSLHLGGAIAYAQQNAPSGVFVAVFTVALVTLLAAALLFVVAFLGANSLWWLQRGHSAAPAGVVFAPASLAFARNQLAPRLARWRDTVVGRAPSTQTPPAARAVIVPASSPPSVSPDSGSPSPPAEQRESAVLDKLDLLLQEQRAFVAAASRAASSSSLAQDADDGTTAAPSPEVAQPSAPTEAEPSDVVARAAVAVLPPEKDDEHRDGGESRQRGRRLRFNLPATAERLSDNEVLLRYCAKSDDGLDEEAAETETPDERRLRKEREWSIKQRRLLLLASRRGINCWSAAT